MKQFEVAFGIFADIIPDSLDSIIYLYYLVAIIRISTQSLVYLCFIAIRKTKIEQNDSNLKYICRSCCDSILHTMWKKIYDRGKSYLALNGFSEDTSIESSPNLWNNDAHCLFDRSSH